MKKLQTQRLTLRPFTLGDLDDFYNYAKDPDIGPSAGWKPHESKQESLEILKDFINLKEDWAIVEKATGKMVGSIGIPPDNRRINPNSRKIGYALSKEVWGRGYATEATKRVLQFAFEEMGVDIVGIVHYPFNLASKRVIEKCGFTYEGTLRQAFRLYNGKVFDDVCYSMTREEYNNKKEAD